MYEWSMSGYHGFPSGLFICCNYFPTCNSIGFRFFPLYHSFERYMVASRPIPFQKLSFQSHFQRCDIGNSTSSAISLGQAYRWYMACRACRKKCTQLQLQQRPKWLPTRLIDIGSPNDLNWSLRIPSRHHISSPNYMTLSYCWGTSNHITLTRDNFEAFCLGKAILDLPQTFRDTILVARRFSIRYIWIDSLCIVQDSREDWETQSLMMRDVYANSACNISAVASTDAYGGLFRMREPREVHAALVESRCNEFASTEKYLVFDQEYWDRQISGTPLNTRGWVFQERFLAPRVLHFAEQQIFWECFEEQKCEGFPLGIPFTLPPKNLDPLFERTGPDDLVGAGLQISAHATEVWRKIVQSYSKCSLTKQSDSLIALSGLACVFQERFEDEYLAGLWKSRLHEFLQWRTRSPDRKPSTYIAPSWSWASISSPVYYGRYPYGDENYNSLIVVLHAKVEARSDSVGEVVGGSLTLKGLVTQGTCFRIGTNKFDESAFQLEVGREKLRLRIWQDAANTIPDTPSEYSFLALTCPEHKFETASDRQFTLQGLVLSKASEVPETYVRVGYFSIIDTEDIELFGISLIRRKHSNFVASVDGDKLSIITII